MTYRYRATFTRSDGSSYDTYELNLHELGRHFIAKAEHCPGHQLLGVLVLPEVKPAKKGGPA